MGIPVYQHERGTADFTLKGHQMGGYHTSGWLV